MWYSFYPAEQQITTKLATENNTLSFCGSEVQIQFNWVLWLGSHKAAIKVWTWPGFLSEAQGSSKPMWLLATFLYLYIYIYLYIFIFISYRYRTVSFKFCTSARSCLQFLATWPSWGCLSKHDTCFSKASKRESL